MNERQTVEMALPVMAIRDVVAGDVRDASNPVRFRFLTRADALLVALVAGHDSDKVLRRTRRAYDLAAAPMMREAARLDIHAYGLYWMLRVLTDADYLMLGQDEYRSFAEDFLSELAENKLSDSDMTRAKSHGRAMLQTYQALGYYRGGITGNAVPWPESLP